jgi:hypothetical protein
MLKFFPRPFISEDEGFMGGRVRNYALRLTGKLKIFEIRKV